MPDEQGPWLKYAKQAPAEPAGPWTRYASTEPKPAPNPGKNWSDVPAWARPTTPAPQSHAPTWKDDVQQSANFLGDELKGVGSALNPINMVTGAYNTIRHPIDTAKNLIALPGQMAEQFKSGDQAGLAQNIGNIAGQVIGAKAGPDVANLAGRVIKAPAPAFAETAMGVRNVDRAYGRAPGQAILEDTKGVLPSTVARSARGKIGELNNQLEGLVKQSNTPVSLQGPRDVLNDATNKAMTQNSLQTVNEINPMVAHFQGNQFTGQKFGPAVTPEQALNLKRGFGNDHVNWRVQQNRGDLANTAGKQAYHALDKSIDAAVPGSEPLNARMSALSPVISRAEQRSLNAGTLQNVMHRVGAHTGALTSAVGGAFSGAHFGTPGAIIGGAAGLIGPELIGSPTAQMIAARTLYRSGKALQSPLGQTAARVAPLVTNGKPRQTD